MNTDLEGVSKLLTSAGCGGGAMCVKCRTSGRSGWLLGSDDGVVCMCVVGWFVFRCLSNHCCA